MDAAILNYTNTKVFLTHGGANSIHETLYTGTRALILPLTADQYGNAQRIESAGCTVVALDKYHLSVSEIVDKTIQVLTNVKLADCVERTRVLARLSSRRRNVLLA